METELIYTSALDLATMIRDGQISCEAVVSAHLAQIERVNATVNAVTVTAPDALRAAREADAALTQGKAVGPLHGVPFVVKDVFATPGLYSKLDTHIRQRAQPREDAVAVARLRKAGAILLAKANCPPNGAGTDTENALYGRTVNPYDGRRSPGGSSGGPAALVAAGCAPIGIGSDLSGGLRVPAAYCGVAGLKPTSGRVPNSGAYNQPGGLTDPRTQIGPLTRRVADLMPVLRVLTGPDGRDAGVVPMPLPDPAAVDVRRLRVAYMPDDAAAPAAPELRNAVAAAAQALARAGVQVTGDHPDEFIGAGYEIDDFWKAMAGAPGRTWVELFAMWDDYRSYLLHFMQRYDAFLCPASPHPAPPFRDRDPHRFAYTVPFSLTGYPCTVVRTDATTAGLPLAVQVAAHPWREDVAVALADLLEREFGGWQAPGG